jgi:hypothetical protein
MSQEDKHPEPRWKEINKLYDTLDESFTESIEKHNLNYIEIEIAMLMFKEKIDQQKMELYHMYLHDKDIKPEEKKEETERPEPENLYK